MLVMKIMMLWELILVLVGLVGSTKIYWECDDGQTAPVCLCWKTPGNVLSPFQAADVEPNFPKWFYTTSVVFLSRPSNRTRLAYGRCAIIGYPNDGRLGNQLFFYATIQGLARRQGRPALIYENDKYPPELRAQPIPTVPGTEFKDLFPVEKHSVTWNNRGYERYRGTRVVVAGYAWYWGMFAFEPLISSIRKQFRVRPNVESKIQQQIANATETFHLKPTDVTLVGVHVRRGDMLWPDRRRMRYLASPQYLDLAMTHFAQTYNNSVFLVASDSMPWCMENINSTKFRVWFSTENSAIEDFAMLSSCAHSVMTFGSFGWWVAFLAGGETVHMTHFLHLIEPDYYMWNWDTFYPKTWKGIDVSKLNQTQS